MKEPFPAKRDPASAGNNAEPREARRLSAIPADEACSVLVRYHVRMRVQRVYPLTVEVARSGRRPSPGVGSLPALVRPIIPGSLVTPPEQKMDASIPGSQVVFHVTPLARGCLRSARLEVHQQSRPPQTIPLRMKGTTQLPTLLLLVLTFLVPWALVELVRHPMKGEVVVGTEQGRTRSGAPDEVLRDHFRAAVHSDFPSIPRLTSWIANDAYGANFPADRQGDPDAKGEGPVLYNDLASWVSWAYRWVLALSANGLVLYAGVILFLLTLGSWMVLRAVRTSQGQVLLFAAPTPDAGAETLPLGGEDEARTI